MPTGRPRIETWANGGSTTLNGAITAGATSLVVTSAASFPTYPDFRIKIGSEILLVTAISGTTFTVTRGAEGTTAAAHSDSAAITHVITAGSLDQAYADNYGDDPDTRYPYNRILAEGVTKTASDFTWLNQGSATCTDADDGGLVMTTGASEAHFNLRGKYLTAPSTPWTCTAYVWLGNGMARATGASDGLTAGIFLRESSSSKLIGYFLRTDAVSCHKYTNPTTWSANMDSYIVSGPEQMWLQVTDNGTNIECSSSYNGWDWELTHDEGRTVFLTGGADQVGFYIMNGLSDANAEIYIKSWILE